ncbi:MAG: hypothetical protein ACREL9_12940 [Gemmatimonadales bacterium]
MPVPPALATGSTAVWWNPAQVGDDARLSLGLDLLQMASVIGASGFLAAMQVPLARLGRVGLIYGRMELSDLVRTSVSPDPDPGSIPFHTQAIGLSWARSVVGGGSRGSGVLVGATLAHHDTRLDLARSQRWTLDVGVEHRVADGVRIAAATHFFSGLHTDNAEQDFYTGVEGRFWRRPLWKGGVPAEVLGRVGLTLGAGLGSDLLTGVGLELGDGFGMSFLVAREGGYGDAEYRPIAGLRVGIGRYRLSFSRDAGVNGIGSAYRVGIEARRR